MRSNVLFLLALQLTLREILHLPFDGKDLTFQLAHPAFIFLCIKVAKVSIRTRRVSKIWFLFLSFIFRGRTVGIVCRPDRLGLWQVIVIVGFRGGVTVRIRRWWVASSGFEAVKYFLIRIKNCSLKQKEW